MFQFVKRLLSGKSNQNKSRDSNVDPFAVPDLSQFHEIDESDPQTSEMLEFVESEAKKRGMNVNEYLDDLIRPLGNVENAP